MTSTLLTNGGRAKRLPRVLACGCSLGGCRDARPLPPPPRPHRVESSVHRTWSALPALAALDEAALVEKTTIGEITPELLQQREAWRRPNSVAST